MRWVYNSGFSLAGQVFLSWLLGKRPPLEPSGIDLHASCQSQIVQHGLSGGQGPNQSV